LLSYAEDSPTVSSNLNEDNMKYTCAVTAPALTALMVLGFIGPAAHAQDDSVSNENRVFATTKTSTLEKELNEAAEAGFRFSAVMGGETAFGGKEVVAVMTRPTASGSPGRFAYKLLATTKTSTMEKELREAADAGFEYRGQTVFESLFGGQEVVVILERDKDVDEHGDYKLIATSKTSTLEKELLEAGNAGYAVVGITVSKTALGGKELVAIVRRPMVR
jgi:hypothetical protein